jgi:cytoskeletal protein RodZ
MEMENNPIDQLFASKLRHLEKAPGQDTWDRLHQLQRAKKSKKVHWFAVAASVLVLILAGLMVWQYTPKTEGLTQGMAPESAQPPVQSNVIQPRSTENSPVTAEPIKRVGNHQILEKSTSLALEKKKVKPTAALPFSTKEVQEKNSLPTEGLAYVKRDHQDHTENLTGTTYESIQAETEQTTVVVLNIEQVAQIDMPIQTTLEEANLEEKSTYITKRKTRAGRIFQQLKKLKNGEKVDWEEVGIRPDNLLALVKPDRESKSRAK